jgi:hypothetical protein
MARRRTLPVGLAVVLGCQRSAPAAGDSARVAATTARAPDSVARADAVFRGRMTVEPGPPPRLVAEVSVWSRGAQPERRVESEESNCNPPLYLRPTGGGRDVEWSDVAWQAQTGDRHTSSPAEVACMGTGLIVMLRPGMSSPFVRRAHPVSVVRGDSLPSGWYDAAVAVVLYGSDTPDGRLRLDTLRVPAGRVWLP